MTAYWPPAVAVVVGLGLRFVLTLVLALLAHWGPEPKAQVEVETKSVFSITKTRYRVTPRRMKQPVVNDKPQL
jgi:hypothetical protein